MRAMLDELMGEDRDGDRQKYVPSDQTFGIRSPLLHERQHTQSTIYAGLHATSLMRTCASITSAGFVRMKSLTKLEQTLVPALWSTTIEAKGSGRPSVMKKEQNILMSET